jgi:hypothetical protein
VRGVLAIWNLEFLVLGVCLLTAVANAAPDVQITGSARMALAIVEDPRSHRPTVDLGADDFVIQEGPEPREVLSVRVADYPAVVMIDTSGPEENLPLLQKAAGHFIERFGSERAVALGTFGDSPKLVAGFDTERPHLLKELDEVVATASGGSSLLQAAAAAAETLAATGSLFSAIVMLSANPDSTAAVTEGADRADAAAAVVASGAIVHIIASVPGGSAAADRGRAAALRGLAEQTRGQFITIYTAASFEAALDQIATRMASELMIEYLVPNGSTARDVKVGVRMPGARVRGLGVAPK